MIRQLLPCIVVLGILSPVHGEGDPKAVSYEKVIQPLLKERCYSCHDGRKQKADYRVDVKSRAVKGGESGKIAITPGKLDNSELWRRVVSENPDERMPPGDKSLTSAEKTALRAWIEAGAPWPETLANETATATHWALVPPKRPSVPAGEHPIDALIQPSWAKLGLTPTAPADRVTLIRRLSLDLIGLPPTPAEVDSFVNDKSPEAYRKLVERLLASPHYGERWGRLWLDAARYADSDGFEKDKPRQVWFYRDWVIQALNRDLPYDRFIIEQIAGDLLPNATQDQRVATGYLRNSMVNEEGGIDPEQFRMEAMFDRMDAIGKGVLGLTIQCAQCHTHKYDPITQNEYYRMFAFLNNAHESNAAVYTAEEQAKRADIFRRIREQEEELKHRLPDWAERMRAWEATVRTPPTGWTVLKPTNIDGSGGQKNYLLADGSILAAGYSPSKDTSVYTIPIEGTIGSLRLELLLDPSLPRGGPGRSIPAGLFALTEIKLSATMPGKTGSQDIKLTGATADASPASRPLDRQFHDNTKRERFIGPVSYAIDGKDETAWTVDVGPGRSNVPRKAVFNFEKPIDFPKGSVLTVRLVQNHGGWNSNDNQSNNLGRFRLSVAGSTTMTADPVPDAVRSILAKLAEKRTPAETETVFGYWRTTVAEAKAVNEEIERLWAEHPTGATQLVLTERAESRSTRMLKRGDFLKPGDVVQPGVPAALHTLPASAPTNRLGFAQWLVDPKSPTTARALVNRVWQAYFGNGLVGSPEDFGTQGDRPSHPELLDWLACEFMQPTTDPTATPWSMKHLHRVIVTSAAYQRSSQASAEMLKLDPTNSYLARGARFRVDAEVVRDIALSASGLLSEKLGGPSVYPPVPTFLMLPPASYGTKVWPEAQGPDRYRRSLYVFRFRSVPYPVLQAFDAPNGDFACVRRTRSNTPLQALTGLNEPIFVESAKALATRVQKDGGADDASRVTYAFRLCVSRAPTEAERAVLLELLARQRSRVVSPTPLAGGAALALSPRMADEAAWLTVARTLLNLDETMTKE